MPPRQSPSNQNQAGKNTNNSSNQQVPVQAGNPRFKPGLDPDPNPKVVVRAINPPITPDQVVSQAESPSATTLPDVKLEKIRIPRVQNKSIQGYLKAIEAKMTATEKLMKDVVKLQNLQIVTEKELHERKRELYQNTFEEYLLDKTVGFDDKDDPDCTCINIPKKPGGGFPFAGGRRRRRGPGGGSPPLPVLPPMANEEEEEKEGTDEESGLPVRQKPKPELPQLPKEEKEEEPFRIPVPQFPVPPIPFNPFEFDPFEFPGIPMGAAGNIDPTAAFTNPELAKASAGLFDYKSLTPLSFIDPKQDPAIAEVEEFRTWVPQDQVPSPLLAFVPDALEAYEANGKRTTSVDTPHGTLYVGFKNTFDRTPVFKYLTNTGNAQRMAETEKTLDNPFVSSVLKGTQGLNFIGDLMIGTTGRASALPRGPYGINSYGRRFKPLNFNVPNFNIRSNLGTQFSKVKNFNLKNPFGKRRMDIDDPAFDFDLATMEATGYTNPKLRSNLIEDGVDMPTTIREPQPGVTVIQRGNIDASGAMGLYNPSPPPTKQASGGIDEMNLYDSKSKQYFKNISNNIDIPKFADGGFMGWFNKGVNTRIPNESTARFGNPLDYFKKNPDPTTLFGDDALQRGQSNKNFKAGKKPSLFGRPDRAFGLDLVDSVKQRKFVTVPASQGGPMSGPTPVTRELVKRPIRAARNAVKPGNPLVMLAELIINDLVNPQPTAVYDQVTGPNAYYNDPAYKGPMPSQNLENAQGSMMSGSNDPKVEVKPLPPEYIKIPGRKKDKSEVGYEAPGIDIEASPFARKDTAYDPGFGAF